MTASDSRLFSLKQWLDTLSGYGIDSASLRPASSDASFRRYFRVDAGTGSYIVMDAPPEKEKVLPFIQVAELFGQCGVCVPQIVEKKVEAGFLLLSDLGNTTYLQKLDENHAHALYMDALYALVRIQSASCPGVLPEYDRTLLLNELRLFPEWYVARHLKQSLSGEQEAALQKVFDLILANNLAQPYVYVHRDYHSRNLMVLREGNPGILDFQDAVFGPVTYDLVSLLRDAYIVWDEERVLDWVIRYWEQARKAGIPVNPSIDMFYRDFEFMGLQRHLKVLGIFARLCYRDGKTDYLNDLPVVTEYVYKTASRYPELAPLVKLLDTLLQKERQVGYTF
ncbi:MAG: phosphotransferase [Alistipes senegalensis]|nr:phosphotransferase [Oxalobacter formigenes]MCM1281874.1 phosphotransferase [Alistipes senegalensis]